MADPIPAPCLRCGDSGVVYLSSEWTGTRTTQATDIPCPTCKGLTYTDGRFVPHQRNTP